MMLISSRPGLSYEGAGGEGTPFRFRIGDIKTGTGELKAELERLGITYSETRIIGNEYLRFELNSDRILEIRDSDGKLTETLRRAMSDYDNHAPTLPRQLKLQDDQAKPRIMGILNVTPDSFSDGGLFFDRESAVSHALEMSNEGADIIDVGGESTRPGSTPVNAATESERVIPVIRAIADRSDVPISIDTMKPEVASAAIRAGATMVNDVGGLALPEMRRVIAENGCAAVIMHMKGEPRTMQVNPVYSDVVAEVYLFFHERLLKAADDGIAPDSLMIDPGIGFGKSIDHNLQLLSELDGFRSTGRPLLLGASRKSFISALTGEKQGSRLEGSLAAALWGWMKGAAMLRVHDVAETIRFTRVWKSIADAAHKSWNGI